MGLSGVQNEEKLTEKVTENSPSSASQGVLLPKRHRIEERNYANKLE